MNDGARQHLPRRLKHKASARASAAAFAIGAILSPGLAHAYIDPGSTGFVITTVLGAIASAGYLMRGWMSTLRHRIRRLLKGSSPGPRGADGAQVSADAQPEHDIST